MKFEEALTAMRSGAKIRHSYMPEDEYYQACYVTINTEFLSLPPESIEKIKSRGMSIVKMKGGNAHPDMRPKCIFPQEKCSIEPKLHSYPQLNLLWLMMDEWEVMA